MNIKYKKTLLCFSILTAATTFVGCAAPQAVQQEANRLLKGPCNDLFSSGRVGGYQHTVSQIAGKAVFALAQDSTGAQKCAIARSNTDVGSQALGLAGNAVSWEQLEAIALTRCESQQSISAKCRIFARNNEIIWLKPAEKNIDFK